MNSMNCTVYVREGSKGVEVWIGAPIIQRMSGLSLAWHWHLVCVHVHSMSHSGRFGLGCYCCYFRHLLVCSI